MSLLFSTGVIAASGLGAAAPGMVLLTPTSIAHSGTSASIGANGQVTFTAVTSLSLNGVFSADFDNYVVSWYQDAGAVNFSLLYRLRSSGTDATGSNYTYQRLQAADTSVNAARTSSQTAGRITNVRFESATTTYFYGPFLAQPTAARTVGDQGGSADKQLLDHANTHSLSTSYDGITFYTSGGSVTGRTAVYGVRS